MREADIQRLIIKNEYVVVTADRSSFRGRFLGRENSQIGMMLGLFLTDQGNKSVNLLTSMITPYRETPPRIHKSQFQKAHWSLLLYIENRVVFNSGLLEKIHLRCNPVRHQGKQVEVPIRAWLPESGTLVRGRPLMKGYDDYDCIEDLRMAGYIGFNEDEGKDVSYHMTQEGWRVVMMLRKHLANYRGTYDGFSVA